jgi:hypothetical protein
MNRLEFKKDRRDSLSVQKINRIFYADKEIVIYIKKLNILRTILPGREITVRDYKDIPYVNTYSNSVNLVRIV